MTAGRPTKYEERYCQELLDFMERTTHEIVVDRTYYKAPDDLVSENTTDNLVRWSVKWEKHEVFASVFPTLERFCHKIGIHKDTLIEWATATNEDWTLKHPEFSDAYKRAKQIQEAILVENALAGNYNPNFSVFVAKNAFGWKDKSEVDNNIKWELKVNNLSELPTDELIKLANG